MKTSQPTHAMLALLAGLILLGQSALPAADVTQYGVLKGAKYIQSDASPPGEDWVFYQVTGYVRMSTAGAVTEASFTPPGGEAWALLAQDDPRLLQIELPVASTPAELNALFPNGDYAMAMTTTHDGDKNATLSLTGDAYPNTPTFQNFAALGSVNPGAAFTLSWAAFTGGTANDVIEVRVMDGANQAFGSTLAGTATSVNIPANTLAPDMVYSVTLTFIKVTTRNTTSYPGATGLAGYFKSTEAELTTTEGGGGDTTPPELVSSTPANGATGVAPTTPIVFVFNEPMAAAQSIAWSGNLTPANFQYVWSGDGRSLTCTYLGGLPANSMITWALNPAGQPQSFRDVAGNPLPEAGYQGMFTTGASTNNPCDPEDDGRGYGTVSKELNYVQTSAAAPVANPQRPATFLGSVVSPTNNPVTAAKLQVPGGPLLTLTNVMDLGLSFLHTEEFASQAALDTARPAGNYNLQLTRQSGSPSANLSLSGSYPNTPQIMNYDAAQAVDPAAEFVLQFNGFTGASGSDSVVVSLVNPMTLWSWHAPDPCVPRPLPNTATSVTIPAGTLQPATTYEGTLSYTRFPYSSTNAIPDVELLSMLQKSLKFTLKTIGSSPGGSVRFVGWRAVSGGKLELRLQGAVGRSYEIQTSSSLMGGWTPVTTQVIPPGGVATFEITRGAGPTFIRARALPQ